MSESTEKAIHCDFCFAPGPEWVVPARSFNVAVGAEAEVHSVDDEWYACTMCAELVQTNQWDKLLHRVVDCWLRMYEVPMPSEAVEVLRATYVKLRENMTGPVRLM